MFCPCRRPRTPWSCPWRTTVQWSSRLSWPNTFAPFWARNCSPSLSVTCRSMSCLPLKYTLPHTHAHTAGFSLIVSQAVWFSNEIIFTICFSSRSSGGVSLWRERDTLLTLVSWERTGASLASPRAVKMIKEALTRTHPRVTLQRSVQIVLTFHH